MDSSVNHSSSTHESSDVENDTPENQDQDPTPLPSKQEVPAPESEVSEETSSEESAKLPAVEKDDKDSDGQGQLTFDPSIAIEIAQHEARSMEEVIDLSGGFIDGWMKGRTKGVRVEESDDSYSIRLNLVIRYGTNCPELFKQLRERISSQVLMMTGKPVSAINIHIAGIKETSDRETNEDLDHPIGEDFGINF